MNRRGVLTGILATAAAIPVVRLFAGSDEGAKQAPKLKGSVAKKIEKSKAEWKQLLTKQEYDVLRNEATEPPGSSDLNQEKRAGTFTCAGCDLPLFKSEWKYESGTGWPSFWEHIQGHLETKTDFKLVWPRTEYHCARCGGHQGHLFEDGPEPTGQRWCNNGVALNFEPMEKSPS